MRTVNLDHTKTKRSCILEMARALFAAKGYAEASMVEIGRACHLTKPALYHYFKSKEAILEGIFEDGWKVTESKVAAIPKAKNLEDALRLAGREFFTQLDTPTHRELIKIVAAEGRKNAMVRANAMSMANPRFEKHMLEFFGPFLAGRRSPEEIRLFCVQFFGSLFYYVWTNSMLGEKNGMPVDRERYLDHLVRVFAAGR